MATHAALAASRIPTSARLHSRAASRQRLDFADFSGLRPGSCSVSTAAREASFSDVLGAQLVAKATGENAVRVPAEAKLKVAINGFGRIGRNFLRCWHGREDSPLDVVVVNDSGGVRNASHLLKYDSMLGTFKADVKILDDTTISVDGKPITVVSSRDPLKLPWAELGIDIVIEGTGVFVDGPGAGKHIQAGAKKVIITAPAKGADIPTYVVGVNEGDYDHGVADIISNASCTTNCLAPFVKVLDEEFGESLVPWSPQSSGVHVPEGERQRVTSRPSVSPPYPCFPAPLPPLPSPPVRLFSCARRGRGDHQHHLLHPRASRPRRSRWWCSSSCSRGGRSPFPPPPPPPAAGAKGREGVAEVARMGLAGDGSADTAHLSNSENGRFSYGVASSPGKRASMEDFFEARIDDVDGEKVGMFGVYDGHGGVRAAEYVKQHLFSNLIKHPKFITDTKAAIAETYNQTDSEFLKADSSQTRDAGSTASTAIIVGDRLLVANVGDSRAVISKGGQAIAVSRDHKPDQTDERQRIENAGGFVMWAGTWRVGGVLAVSRAFGDKLLKQYVVADPEIKEEVVDSSLEFLILASDGLWDVVTNEEAVAMVKPIQDPQEAAKKLLEEASRRGSSDNITVVIVRFLDGTTTGDKSGEDKETTNDQN